MAGMDLSGRRADRGVSVFWMILAMGAGVFALIAILLVGTGQPTVEEGSEVAENVGGGEILEEAWVALRDAVRRVEGGAAPQPKFLRIQGQRAHPAAIPAVPLADGGGAKS